MRSFEYTIKNNLEIHARSAEPEAGVKQSFPFYNSFNSLTLQQDTK